MHFSADYVDIVGRSPAKGRQAIAGLGNASNLLARLLRLLNSSYIILILGVLFRVSIRKKKQV